MLAFRVVFAGVGGPEAPLAPMQPSGGGPQVPILVRPVREQLEHDRIIRLLEAQWRRKYKVEANPGDERNAAVKVGSSTLYPDLVLTEEGGRKPRAIVEVETGESVNHLEAMAQWANLARSRSSLYLFVPAGSVETARRLATDHQIELSELWTYLVIGDQVRFSVVFGNNGDDEMILAERPLAVPPPVRRPLPVMSEKPETEGEPIEIAPEANAPKAKPRKATPTEQKAVGDKPGSVKATKLASAKPAEIKPVVKPEVKAEVKPVTVKGAASKEAVAKPRPEPVKGMAQAKIAAAKPAALAAHGPQKGAEKGPDKGSGNGPAKSAEKSRHNGGAKAEKAPTAKQVTSARPIAKPHPAARPASRTPARPAARAVAARPAARPAPRAVTARPSNSRSTAKRVAARPAAPTRPASKPARAQRRK